MVKDFEGNEREKNVSDAESIRRRLDFRRGSHDASDCLERTVMIMRRKDWFKRRMD